MDSAEGTINKHLDGNASRGIETLHFRRRVGARQFGFIKVSHYVPQWVGGFQWLRLRRNVAFHKESILSIIGGARLRGLHFEPARRSTAHAAPTVCHTRADQ